MLENEPSGRAFLQKAAATPLTVPGTSSFFDALASPRRLLLPQAANEAIARHLTHTQADPFAAFYGTRWREPRPSWLSGLKNAG